MGFDIERREEQRTCVLHVAGDIDAAVVPDLRQALDQAIETGCDNVVINLRAVTYADSSALGLLVWLDRRLQPREGKAVLAGADSNVGRIFELSGILSVAGRLQTEDNVDEALACFASVGADIEPEWTRSLEVPADVKVLAGVRDQVGEMMLPLAFSESALFDIKVALGEALANAVRHGSPDDGSAAVHLGVTCYADRVVIDITDSGAGFDGQHVCSDDLYAVGGRGIMFMRALMDNVCFTCSRDGGTCVTLVKHRPAEVSE